MSEEVKLLPKVKSTSPVWSYFGFEPDSTGKKAKDETKAVCRTCAKVVSVPSNNTSNALQHLKSHHIDLYVKIQASSNKRKRSEVDNDDDNESNDGCKTPSKQPKIANAIARGTAYDHNSSRWKDITKLVTCHIAGDAVPIYTVEKIHFKNLLKSLDPRYELPGRNYFSNTAIPRMYSEVRERVASELEKADYFLLTTDMWSSIGMVPYLGVTVHFIDNMWRLQSRALQTLFFPDAHTADNLADGLIEVLEAWDLKDDKLSCITTDNAANILKAVNDVLSWPQLSCFGHNLNLAITNSYKHETRVTKSFSVCRTIISTFSYSWKRRRELACIQEDLGLPKHQLIADCCTRWGTAHAMANRFLEQETAIRKVLSEDRKCGHLIPRYNEVQVLEAVKQAFDPLAQFTDILSADKYVTFSAVKPLLEQLENVILDTTDDTHSLTSTLKDNVREYLSNKYSKDSTKQLMCFATYVDPRFKNENLLSAEIATIRKSIKSNKQMHIASKDSSSALKTPTKKTAFASLFAKKTTTSSSDLESPASIKLKLDREIAAYESIPCIDIDIDPLDWWRVNQTNYPTIANYARKYLCIYATSVPSERLFSVSGSVVTAKRATLNPDKVNMLTFLKANL